MRFARWLELCGPGADIQKPMWMFAQRFGVVSRNSRIVAASAFGCCTLIDMWGAVGTFTFRNSRLDALHARAPERHHRNGITGTSDHAARFIFEETRSPDDYRAIDACKLFTKPLNGLKTTFPKWSETNPF